VGIRQKLNDASKGVIGLVIVLVIGVYAVVAWEFHRPANGGHLGLKTYYTTDDGKTYFPDDGALFPPFDHEGGQAVRCYVFKCPSSGEFVGYLEKFSPELHDALTTPFDPTHRGDHPPLDFSSGTLVKKPGDKNWIIKASTKGQAIVHVQCPNGSSDEPTAVSP
jgi:hypothetical protein